MTFFRVVLRSSKCTLYIKWKWMPYELIAAVVGSLGRFHIIVLLLWYLRAYVTKRWYHMLYSRYVGWPDVTCVFWQCVFFQFNWIILRWGFLIWELIFIYCGLFVLILVVLFFFVFFCFFFHYVSAKFLPRPRIGMMSLVTVFPVITAFLSCCLSHHVFDQVNLWPAWVGFETAIFWQCSPGLR